MTYEEALTYIHSVIWRGKRIGLGRITELLRRMGNPEKKLRFVHVAGTNGKGSTCEMTASVLQAAGYRTGLFTSPFIHFFNERIQINGMPIPDADLIALTGEIREIASGMEDKPTEFELICALGMAYFYRSRCDIVVLEVGLGGEMDSTNIIDTPEAAVICALGFDHMKELGSTMEEIARAKAGIIKKNSRVVFYGENDTAQTVIEKKVRETESTLVIPDYRKLREGERSLAGQTFSYGRYENLHIRLLGAYQLRNAAVVIETVEILRSRGFAISDEALREGLANARWPGRFELVREKPAVIVDGSHNPQGMRATVNSLREYFPKGGVVFLVGVLADKDAAGMMRELTGYERGDEAEGAGGAQAPAQESAIQESAAQESATQESGEKARELASCYITVTPPSMRAMEAADLAELLRPMTDRPVTAAASLKEGCAMALSAAGADGAVCAMGSLYMVDELEKLLG